MMPTHTQGIAAAKRVEEANEAGKRPDPDDAITMQTYALSIELRRLPKWLRLKRARLVTQQIIENTEESLEDC